MILKLFFHKRSIHVKFICFYRIRIKKRRMTPRNNRERDTMSKQKERNNKAQYGGWKMSNIKRNIITSLLCQIITILYGLFVPKLILGAFGSEVNGLVSSISQFLNYITLLEGGLSGVIMAALYKPLAEKDSTRVSAVINATNQFFRRIALLFVGYMLTVATLYPLFIHTSFSWGFVASLAVIIGITLFIQYFFSLSLRLLINADQKGYVVFNAQIVFTIVNFIFTIIIIKIYPEIHALKVANVIAYCIQPIVFATYVSKNYKLDRSIPPDKDAISQRWAGFGQNLAYFIHTNTDVAVLTIFCTLLDVSVYTVYFMVIGSLKKLVMSISSAIIPSIGNTLASGDTDTINEAFDVYETGINLITTFSFACGIILIVPFVNIYTAGINDADYIQPVFGILLMIAEAIYCYRDPYVSIAYASGKFKETAKYSYIEAISNIVISVVLVIRFGLVGVAVGTFVSMCYRFIMHVIYIKKNIINRPISKFATSFARTAVVLGISVVLAFVAMLKLPTSYGGWIIMAFADAGIVALLILVVQMVFNRKQFTALLKLMLKRHR